MTTIYLIRHGQASVGTDNYDVLSKTGEAQANVLGQHLVSARIEFDAVYSGALKRQIDTATIATEGSGVPVQVRPCLLYTSPSPRDRTRSRMPSSA